MSRNIEFVFFFFFFILILPFIFNTKLKLKLTLKLFSTIHILFISLFKVSLSVGNRICNTKSCFSSEKPTNNKIQIDGLDQIWKMLKAMQDLPELHSNIELVKET